MSISDLVPFVDRVLLFVCPLLHWMVQLNRSPSVSLIGMFQLRLSGLLVELFVGVGDPNVGGWFVFVVRMYHSFVYSPLPVGSVAFTQMVYVVE